jgi:uncharacterized protein with ParB-like and HNH nuclease domain
MENKVYYGEYSLKHWIDLILKKNIILPEYQRYFVWKEDDVRTLINTFKEKRFVPPVTIGALKNMDSNQNLILDGQQRLTSILLAYLGLYPDEKTYKATIEKFANENDDEDDKEEFDNVIEWTFATLSEKGNTKEKILESIKEGNYKTIDLEINDDFLKDTFLGFSYLVPHTLNEIEQQKYYSTVFRYINIQGKTLLPQESRKSLYFLDKNLAQFFEPDFCKSLTTKIVGSEQKFDFVRCLSLLSQYYKDKNANNIAKYHAGKEKMEKYYEEYIYAMADENDSNKFVGFSTVFPDKNYKTRFDSLKDSISALEIPKQYSSMIESDVYLLGLIYEIVFEGNAVDNTKRSELKSKLEGKITEFKGDTSHTKSPAALKHLRNRIDASIGIYKKIFGAK